LIRLLFRMDEKQESHHHHNHRWPHEASKDHHRHRHHHHHHHSDDSEDDIKAKRRSHRYSAAGIASDTDELLEKHEKALTENDELRLQVHQLQEERENFNREDSIDENNTSQASKCRLMCLALLCSFLVLVGVKTKESSPEENIVTAPSAFPIYPTYGPTPSPTELIIYNGPTEEECLAISNGLAFRDQLMERSFEVDMDVTLEATEMTDDLELQLAEKIQQYLVPALAGCPDEVGNGNRQLVSTKYVIAGGIVTVHARANTECEEDAGTSCFRAIASLDLLLKGEMTTFEFIALMTGVFSNSPLVTRLRLDLPYKVIVIVGVRSTSPTEAPSVAPSLLPSESPSRTLVVHPTTEAPTRAPVTYPTAEAPAKGPNLLTSRSPSSRPSSIPSVGPTAMPSSSPSLQPTPFPSLEPTPSPTPGPTGLPSPSPTRAPTLSTTSAPVTAPPSSIPSAPPTETPSTMNPTASLIPSASFSPTASSAPSTSFAPSTSQPSFEPSVLPTPSPTQQTCFQTNTELSNAVDDWFQGSHRTASVEALYGLIGDWCFGAGVTSMRELFYFRSTFNEDISKWDVSSVTNMYGMFKGASSFNQNLSSWDVSTVRNMNGMFHDSASFNQNLCQWGSHMPSWSFLIVWNNVADMFENTNCPSTASPNLALNPKGPFCHVC